MKHPGPGAKTDQPVDLRKRAQQDREVLNHQLVERYQAGEGIKALATDLGMHHRTAKKRLEAAGITPRRRHVLTDDQIQQATVLYSQGWSAQRIGTEFGVSHTTIKRHLHQLGVAMRPMGRPPKA